MTTCLETHRFATCRVIAILLTILCALPWLGYAQTNRSSKDGYLRREGNDWVLGTSLTERRLHLADGHLSLTSLRDKNTGREYVDTRHPADEIQFFANDQDASGLNWRWKLRNDHAALGAQGELQLDIELESANLLVTKHYVIYPGTAVIREWLTIETLPRIQCA